MELAQIAPALIALAGAFIVGLGVGMLSLRRAAATLRKRNRELEMQAKADQLELRQVHRQLAGHRNDVAKHFEQTSDLFRDLTRQYTALYAHLAEGARELCPDTAIPLGQGLDAPQLLTGPEPPASAPLTESEDAEAEPEEGAVEEPEATDRLHAVRAAVEAARDTALEDKPEPEAPDESPPDPDARLSA